VCVAGDAGHAAQFDPVRMSSVDKQRITAVENLKQLGYSFSCATGWTRPQGDDKSRDSLVVEADALHALLVLRADRLIHDAPFVGRGARSNGAEEDYSLAAAHMRDLRFARRCMNRVATVSLTASTGFDTPASSSPANRDERISTRYSVREE
jgi:hypothetical protein